MFKVYNIMVWYTYAQWNDYYSQANYDIISSQSYHFVCDEYTWNLLP